jgi:hypothetical protein
MFFILIPRFSVIGQRSAQWMCNALRSFLMPAKPALGILIEEISSESHHYLF